MMGIEVERISEERNNDPCQLGKSNNRDIRKKNSMGTEEGG